MKGKDVKGKVWIGKENLIKNAEVAVILGSFNRPTMAERAIESVLEQTYDYLNLYIMDNNSLVEVKDVLLEYQDTPRVAIYFSDTQASQRLDKYWFGVMMNLGIKQGTEPYIVCLSDDCYMLPESIETKVDFMHKNMHVEICFGGQHIIDQQGKLLRIRHYLPYGQQIIRGACIVDMCQVMTTRRLLKQIGGFNEDLDRKPYAWADAILFDEALKLGFTLHSVGAKTDVFIEHGKSLMECLRNGKKNQLLSNEIWE